MRLVATLVAAGSLFCGGEVSANEQHHDALRSSAYLMVRDFRDSIELPADDELCVSDMCQVCHVAQPPDQGNFGAPFLLQLFVTGGWSYEAAKDLDRAEQIDLMLDAMETMASSENEDYYDPETEVVDFDEDGVDDFLEIITGFSPNPGDDTDYCARIPLEYGCGASIANAQPTPSSSPWSAGALASIVSLGLAWNLWRRRRTQR